MENKKTFEVVIAYEVHDTYTVEAASEEEAQEIALSDDGCLEDRYAHSYTVIESKEIYEKL